MSLVTGRCEAAWRWFLDTLSLEACVYLVAEWLYHEIGNVRSPDPKLAEQIKTEGLRSTVSAFIVNVRRAREFWKFAPHLMEVAAVNVHNLVEAIFALKGRPFLKDEEKEDKELMTKITSLMSDTIRKRFEQTGSQSAATGYNFQRALDSFDKMSRIIPHNDEAIHAALSTQLQLIWTAFETLAGDIWEQAINVHPETLFNLSGIRRRIAKRAGAIEQTESIAPSGKREPSLISLPLLYQSTAGTFDARNKMGTILKEKFSLQRLSGLREAYSAAFSKDYEKIDAALSDRSLDRLTLARNVIAHRAGTIDQDFLDGVAAIDWKVPDKLNERIVLSGERVRDLIAPVIQKCVDLIWAVDDWIAASATGLGLNDADDDS